MSDTVLWLTIIACGLVTYSIRLSFIALLGKISLPPMMARGLRFVPVVVLPALVAPALFYQQGQLDISLSNARLIAGVVAVSVSALTKNVLLTIVVGMLTLWSLQWLLG